MSSPWIDGLAQRRARRARPRAGRSVLHATPGSSRSPRATPTRSSCAAAAPIIICSRCTAAHAPRRSATSRCARATPRRSRDRGGDGRRRRSRPAWRPSAADDPAGGSGLLIRDRDGRRLRGGARRCAARRRARGRRTGRSGWPTSCSTATRRREPALPRAGARLRAGRPHPDHGVHELQPRPPQHRPRRRRQRRAQPHRLPDARPRLGDARRRPHEGRRAYAIEWGPGRHGPGNNAFNYFIDPFGVVIEYTAEVEQIDDELPRRRARRLDLAARARRPVGHLAAAEPAPEGGAARASSSSRPGPAPDRSSQMSFTTYLHDGTAASRRRRRRRRHRPERGPAAGAGRPARRARRRRRPRRRTRAPRSPRPRRACRSPALTLRAAGARAGQDRSASASTISTTPRKAAAKSPTIRGSSSAAATLAGRHGAPGRVPRVSSKFDYEAELAVVIGTRVPRHVPRPTRSATSSATAASTTCPCATTRSARRNGRSARTSTRTGGFGPGAGHGRRAAAGRRRACASRPAERPGDAGREHRAT